MAVRATWRGVVVSVRADADGAQDRDPARNRRTDRTLSDLDAYPFCSGLQSLERRAPNDDPFAGPNHQIADGLRRGVPEQAVQQLFLGQGGGFAVQRRNVRDHLRLQFPDRDKVGQDRQPAPGARGQRQATGYQCRFREPPRSPVRERPAPALSSHACASWACSRERAGSRRATRLDFCVNPCRTAFFCSHVSFQRHLTSIYPTSGRMPGRCCARIGFQESNPGKRNHEHGGIHRIGRDGLAHGDEPARGRPFKLRVFNREQGKNQAIRRQGHRGLRFARRGGEGRRVRLLDRLGRRRDARGDARRERRRRRCRAGHHHPRFEHQHAGDVARGRQGRRGEGRRLPRCAGLRLARAGAGQGAGDPGRRRQGGVRQGAAGAAARWGAWCAASATRAPARR